MTTQDPSPQPPQGVTPTPEWSRALAELTCSSFGPGWTGKERCESFIEEALQYATYDAMPDDLKAIYDKAYRDSHDSALGASTS